VFSPVLASWVGLIALIGTVPLPKTVIGAIYENGMTLSTRVLNVQRRIKHSPNGAHAFK
jgi:hypothetical protein